jgi:hypothetical protein
LQAEKPSSFTLFIPTAAWVIILASAQPLLQQLRSPGDGDMAVKSAA